MNEKLIKFTVPWAASSPWPERIAPAAAVPSKTRILVAEDDPISRTLISTRLEKWGHAVIATSDGAEAMAILRRPDAPSLAILDWSMPEMDGVEVCRRVREANRMAYLIMLTTRGSRQDMIEGLRAGADDYLVKPFDAEELHARIFVGLRVMASQERLAARVKELEAATSKFESLTLQIPL